MNLKKTLKYFSLAAVSVLAIGALVACSSSSEKKTEKIKVEVGTVGTTKPFSYEDKDGKLTGYDIEVLRAIFKDSDKYEVNFNKTKWASISQVWTATATRSVPIISAILRSGLTNISMLVHMRKIQQF